MINTFETSFGIFIEDRLAKFYLFFIIKWVDEMSIEIIALGNYSNTIRANY